MWWNTLVHLLLEWAWWWVKLCTCTCLAASLEIRPPIMLILSLSPPPSPLGCHLWLLWGLGVSWPKVSHHSCLHVPVDWRLLHRVRQRGVGSWRSGVQVLLLWQLYLWGWPVWAPGQLPEARGRELEMYVLVRDVIFGIMLCPWLCIVVVRIQGGVYPQWWKQTYSVMICKVYNYI